MCDSCWQHVLPLRIQGTAFHHQLLRRYLLAVTCNFQQSLFPPEHSQYNVEDVLQVLSEHRRGIKINV